MTGTANIALIWISHLEILAIGAGYQNVTHMKNISRFIRLEI